jgi:hypothetical protein
VLDNYIIVNIQDVYQSIDKNVNLTIFCPTNFGMFLLNDEIFFSLLINYDDFYLSTKTEKYANSAIKTLLLQI